MRLIDADRLTSEMQKLITNNDTLIDEWMSDRIIEEIEDAPTIGVEPVKPVIDKVTITKVELYHALKDMDSLNRFIERLIRRFAKLENNKDIK